MRMRGTSAMESSISRSAQWRFSPCFPASRTSNAGARFVSVRGRGCRRRKENRNTTRPETSHLARPTPLLPLFVRVAASVADPVQPTTLRARPFPPNGRRGRASDPSTVRRSSSLHPPRRGTLPVPPALARPAPDLVRSALAPALVARPGSLRSRRALIARK